LYLYMVILIKKYVICTLYTMLTFKSVLPTMLKIYEILSFH